MQVAFWTGHAELLLELEAPDWQADHFIKKFVMLFEGGLSPNLTCL